jgi:hypothetical protein
VREVRALRLKAPTLRLKHAQQALAAPCLARLPLPPLLGLQLRMGCRLSLWCMREWLCQACGGGQMPRGPGVSPVASPETEAAETRPTLLHGPPPLLGILLACGMER